MHDEDLDFSNITEQELRNDEKYKKKNLTRKCRLRHVVVEVFKS